MVGSYMSLLVRSVKRPTTWVLLGAWLTLNIVFSYALPYASHLTGDAPVRGPAPLDSVLPDQLVANSIGGFALFGGAVVLIFGALTIGSEYGWGTVKTLLSQGPSRLAVFGGMAGALVTAMLAVVVISFGVGAGISAVLAGIEGQSMNWPSIGDLFAGAGAGWLILSMWCLIGGTLGVLFRGVAVPIGLGVVWVIGVENLLSNVAENLLTSLQPVRDILPVSNAGSLIFALTSGTYSGDGIPGVIEAVGGTRAMVTLLVYILVSVAVSAVVVRRRDVT